RQIALTVSGSSRGVTTRTLPLSATTCSSCDCSSGGRCEAEMVRMSATSFADRFGKDIHRDRAAARHGAGYAAEHAEPVLDLDAQVLGLDGEDGAGIGEVEVLEQSALAA